MLYRYRLRQIGTHKMNQKYASTSKKKKKLKDSGFSPDCYRYFLIILHKIH